MFTFIKRIYFLNSSLGFESVPKNETISIIIRNFCPLVDPDLSCINCVISFTLQWFLFLPKVKKKTFWLKIGDFHQKMDSAKK